MSQSRSLSQSILSALGGNIRIPLFIFLIVSVSGLTLQAQDLIKLKSGKEIRANIIQDGTDVIKYREYENPSGPVYSVKKELVESVKYKKGKREAGITEGKPEINESVAQADTGRYLSMKNRYVTLNGKVQSSRNVKQMMAENPDALANFEKGRKMCDLSNSCAYGIIILSLTTSVIANGKSDPDESRKIMAIGLGIDGGLLIGGIILAIKGKQNIRRSVDIYNSSLSKSVTYKVDFGIQDNGIGFALRF